MSRSCSSLSPGWAHRGRCPAAALGVRLVFRLLVGGGTRWLGAASVWRGRGLFGVQVFHECQLMWFPVDQTPAGKGHSLRDVSLSPFFRYTSSAKPQATPSGAGRLAARNESSHHHRGLSLSSRMIHYYLCLCVCVSKKNDLFRVSKVIQHETSHLRGRQHLNNCAYQFQCLLANPADA